MNQPSVSPRHMCTAVVKLVMGCPRQLVFWHSCRTCFKASIKVFSMATWSTVTSLIKMLCLFWSEGWIYQPEIIRSKKNTEVPSSFVMASYLFVPAIWMSSAKTNFPRPTPFSFTSFLVFYSALPQLHNDSRLLKELSTDVCCCRCGFLMWNVQKKHWKMLNREELRFHVLYMASCRLLSLMSAVWNGVIYKR